jgi:prepilin-type N-terminal cleavage/methylation domain-containing protein
MRLRQETTRGFTLVELMTSMALGLIIMASAAMLFKMSVGLNFTTSQRAELQSDFRAASNLIAQDIGMAGAGSPGQAGLATGSVPVSSTPSVYPCSTTTCNYINGSSVAYPSLSGAYYLYSVMPGPNLGITVNGQQTDIITLSYTDANLSLDCYNVTYTSSTSLTFTQQSPLSGSCQSSLNMTTGQSVTPQTLNGSSGNPVGLFPGDTILISTTSGPAALAAVSSVSSPSNCGGQPCYVVSFATGDPGHLNQTSGTGSVGSLSAASITGAVRQMVITYYLDISPVDGVTPRLMRLQSGKTPVPVVENVVYLKFTYDVDEGATYYPNQSALPTGSNPSMITKVNIAHMTMRSQLHGQTGYQGLDLQTSVCPRNLTFGQEYPITGTPY